MRRISRRADPMRSRAFVAALTAIAFALLVSLAATHVHLSSVDEDGCEICSAVVGHLATPATIHAVPTPLVIEFALLAASADRTPRWHRSNLLPPSRGPPHKA